MYKSPQLGKVQTEYLEYLEYLMPLSPFSIDLSLPLQQYGIPLQRPFRFMDNKQYVGVHKLYRVEMPEGRKL